uniref:Glycoprotein n=1 Tax=Xiangshan rhabdo-like virus 2 TaxID=2886225 RepID=A0A8K1YQP7_9RHAB|nr:MAG: hypothetical protein [Xiangshan rhabdo-like virus 2]
MRCVILFLLVCVSLLVEKNANHHQEDPDSRNQIHPKIRVIDPSQLIKRVSQNIDYVCSPLNIEPGSSSVKTAIHIYKQNPLNREFKVFVFSAYGVTTSCHMKWYFSTDKEVINDIPIPMESIPRDKLLVVLNSMRNLNASQFNPDLIKQETFEEDLYNCFFMQTNLKTTSVLRIRVISVVIGWSGIIVSPHIPGCTVHNSTCNIDSSSFLVIPPSLGLPFSNNTCDLIEIGTFLGELFYTKKEENPKQVKLLKFVSHNSHISITPSPTPIDKYQAPCVLNNSPLMISQEGILYTIRTHAGLDVLKMIRGRGKRSTSEPWIPREAQVSPVILPVVNLPSQKSTPRRPKRGISASTPLSVSETWIYEFAASQSVAQESILDDFMNLTSHHIHQIYLTQCKERKSNLQIGWALRSNNHRIYISELIQSDQFLSKYSNFGINWGTGSLVLSIDLDNLRWCDFSLIVNVTSPTYSGQVLVRNIIGVAVPIKEPLTCDSDNPPSSFVIPVFSLKYYDIIKEQFVKPDLPSATDDNPLFSRLMTLNYEDLIANNSSFSSLSSSLVFAPFLTDSNINRQSMFGSSRSASWAELIVDNIIVPVLSFLLASVLAILIIRVILACVCSRRSTTSTRSASFF